MNTVRFFRFIFSVFFVISVNGAYAQTVQSGLLDAKKSVHEFGAIAQGRPVYHVFQLENKSSIPVLIENVQASCGCTTPEWDKEPVAPGGKTNVRIGFNAAAEGPFEKTIQVFYQQGKQLELAIRGNVWKTPDQPAPPNKTVTALKTVRFK
jgi:hypothetical protein